LSNDLLYGAANRHGCRCGFVNIDEQPSVGRMRLLPLKQTCYEQTITIGTLKMRSLYPAGHAQQTLGGQFAHGMFDKERITRIVKGGAREREIPRP
jgi:hypothetical protein